MMWLAWFASRELPVSLAGCNDQNLTFAVSLSPENPAEDYTYAFHGLRAYALRSALRRGLTESKDEGGRHAYKGDGVYSSCKRDVAAYDAVPSRVFGDYQMYAILLRFRLVTARTQLGIKGAFGPENLTQHAKEMAARRALM